MRLCHPVEHRIAHSLARAEDFPGQGPDPVVLLVRSVDEQFRGRSGELYLGSCHCSHLSRDKIRTVDRFVCASAAVTELPPPPTMGSCVWFAGASVHRHARHAASAPART